jgi:hypothetical protein
MLPEHNALNRSDPLHFLPVIKLTIQPFTGFRVRPPLPLVGSSRLLRIETDQSAGLLMQGLYQTFGAAFDASL